MICARFHIPWDQFGQLTLYEVGVLAELLEEERRAVEQQ